MSYSMWRKAFPEKAAQLDLEIAQLKDAKRAASVLRRKAAEKKRRQEHPEKRRAQKQRAAARKRLKRIEYIAAHPEIAQAKRELSEKKLREKKKRKKHARRARERDAPGRLTPGITDRLFKSQAGKCVGCGDKMTEFHLDHIEPLAGGGTNFDKNIQLLCPKCNFKKSDMNPVDFMQIRGFLL